MTRSRFRSLGVAAARAADEKKAEDVVLRRVAAFFPLCEYVLVASVNSHAQMEAVQEKIRLALKSEGMYVIHRDGPQSDLWRILDYGGLIVHVMHPKARDFYSIDKLFREGRRVSWTDKAGAPRKRKRR